MTSPKPPLHTLVSMTGDTLSADSATDGTGQLGLVAVDRAHYAVGVELARGGMGRILAARDLRLDRDVAIKELLSPSPDARARFEREARITARLQHPAIVNILEAGVWPSGEPFYAMKRVTGDPLDAAIAKAKTLEARLALLPNVITVVEALAYAHQRRVIHRDLKPSNVLVGEFGETVVIDWGLAKDLRSNAPEPDLRYAPPTARREDASAPGETVAGSVLGTPSYMPVEQALGESVDETADVYALGALLYHLLAGAAPYTGASAGEVLARVVVGPPPPLASRVDGVPPDLVAIVDKAMARAPGDRYASAGPLAADLRRFQTGQLVGVHHYSLGQLARRWLRKNRALVTLGAVAFGVIAVGGGIAIERILSANRDARTEAENSARLAAEAQHQTEVATTQMNAAQARTAEVMREQGRQELLAGHADRAAPLLAATYRGPGDRIGQVLVGAALERLRRQTALIPVAHTPAWAMYLDSGQTIGLAATPDGPMDRYSVATGAKLDSLPSVFPHTMPAPPPDARHTVLATTRRCAVSVTPEGMWLWLEAALPQTVALPIPTTDVRLSLDDSCTRVIAWDKTAAVLIPLDTLAPSIVLKGTVDIDIKDAAVSADGASFLVVSSSLTRSFLSSGDARDPKAKPTTTAYRSGLLSYVAIDSTAKTALVQPLYGRASLLDVGKPEPLTLDGVGPVTAAAFFSPERVAIADAHALWVVKRYTDPALLAAVDGQIDSIAIDGLDVLAVSSTEARSFQVWPDQIAYAKVFLAVEVSGVSDDGRALRRYGKTGEDVAVELDAPDVPLADLSPDGTLALACIDESCTAALARRRGDQKPVGRVEGRGWFATDDWLGLAGPDGVVLTSMSGEKRSLVGCTFGGTQHVWVSNDASTAVCATATEVRRWDEASKTSTVIDTCTKAPPFVIAGRGSHVVYGCDKRARMIDLAGTSPTELRPGRFSISDDGKRLIAVRDGHIEIMAFGAAPLPAFGNGIRMASERGGLVYAMATTGALSVWDPERGLLLHEIANDAPSTMVVSPDGGTMAVSTSVVARMFTVPLETRSPEEVIADVAKRSGWQLVDGHLARK